MNRIFPLSVCFYIIQNQGYSIKCLIKKFPAMLEREKIVTTYIGMGLAIPHGTTHESGIIKKTGIVLLQYPEGVDFGDEKAQLVIGIAGMGGEHMEVLSKVCMALEDEEVLDKMKTTDDKEWILKQLS